MWHGHLSFRNPLIQTVCSNLSFSGIMPNHPNLRGRSKFRSLCSTSWLISCFASDRGVNNHPRPLNRVTRIEQSDPLTLVWDFLLGFPIQANDPIIVTILLLEPIHMVRLHSASPLAAV